MTRDALNSADRWGIEHRRGPGDRWALLGTVGSYRQAFDWLIRFSAGGDFRIRPPGGCSRRGGRRSAGGRKANGR
ncbi:hypothetical protein [Limnoglobus roseus]|uniref:Uncharacterized protein n=1 Tax=Limnoglobus roseus TaxID=2598579 RepID=A0A5C1ADW7_9BACT|nr:hypothetical protein [Limnoglobus roseus]QEL15902.1 hypothetical protein PX52LOC_02838 [Limnoglobus roseus]